MKKSKILSEEDKVDLTPMIDIVFLLLIYFMVTMQLIKEEADLGMTLPVDSESTTENNEIPEEAYVEVLLDGQVLLNGAPVDSVVGDLPELQNQLKRLKSAADRGGVPFFVTIAAELDSYHQRSIDVLNACAAAKIKMVSFASAGE